jgi:hypothetical protein
VDEVRLEELFFAMHCKADSALKSLSITKKKCQTIVNAFYYVAKMSPLQSYFGTMSMHWLLEHSHLLHIVIDPLQITVNAGVHRRLVLLQAVATSAET